ncbi:MAG: M20/M25/M40 family metallo-hydrolase [Myxococcota bacterium]
MPRWSRAAIVLVVNALACSAPVDTPKPAPHALKWLERVDQERVNAELTTLLQGYLRVDTANPPGNETEGARYLAKALEQEGIPYEILEFAPGRGSLVATLPATGTATAGPLCLLSHIDVATAEPERWPQDKGPFSGAIDDGMLWGRGALDMKGMGALELVTFLWLKRLAVPLTRPVTLIAVADEESGNQGMKFLVANHWDKLRCEHMVNEGGMPIRDLLLEGQSVAAISVAEKGVLWVRMTAHGEAGHGSTPLPGRAPERLMQAVQKIQARKIEARVDPSLVEMLQQVGRSKGGVLGWVLQNPEPIMPLITWGLMRQPMTRAALTDTANITGFSGALEPNVIPSQVTAQIDCRLLPGTTPEQMLERLKDAVDHDPNITFDVIAASPANGSTWDDPFFRALAAHATAGRSDMVAGPVLSVGYTDSLLARPKGTRAYGFVPIEIPQELAATMHGRDERVPLRALHQGLRVLMGAVLEVSTAP